MADAKGKVALVTGGTSGIGRAAATALARQGVHVTIVARNKAKGESTMKAILAAAPGGKVEVLVCDLASQGSVRGAAKEFLKTHERLDVLVNAAGVFLPTRSTTVDGVETTFATNYLGHFLLTQLLLPALQKGSPSRVVNVASRYGGAKIDFDDLMHEKRKFTYMSAVPPTKLAQVLFTQELAARLEGTGVVVNAVHPGLVKRTQIFNEVGGGLFRWITNTFGGTPEKGADTVVWLATAPEAASLNGKMWSKRKPMKTPGQGSDEAARQRLWEESEKLLRPSAPPKPARP